MDVVGGYGCQNRGGEFNSCVTTTYRVVGADSSANPWASDFQRLTGTGGLDSALITFDPGGSCGIPECSQIYLVQSVRVVAISGSDSVCVAIGQMGYPFGPAGIDSMSATVTSPPECTFIDEVPGDHDPYMNGSDINDNGRSGRSGPNPISSTASDKPGLSVPAGADEILAEFEVNAYCGAGKNKGRYLGKTFWPYERGAADPKGTIRRDPRRSADLGPPTGAFRRADSLYRDGSFSQPQPMLPSKGGVKCAGY